MSALTTKDILHINKETKETEPGQPIPTAYTLFYRHGVNPKCEKGFMHVGDIRSANRRAQEHCKIMGYTFIFVRPLIVDLEIEERRQLSLPDSPKESPGMIHNT